eukprot:1193958-Prorocentrum_minimum.AAC.2
MPLQPASRSASTYFASREVVYSAEVSRSVLNLAVGLRVARRVVEVVGRVRACVMGELVEDARWLVGTWGGSTSRKNVSANEKECVVQGAHDL